MNARSLTAAACLLALALAACNKADTTYQGWIEANLIFVAPDEVGRVQALSVREGDTVKTGEPLFTVDDDLQQADIAQVKASLINAQQTFDRASQLAKTGAGTQKDLDQATAVLRDRHHLRPEEEDDFNIRNPEDIIQAQLDASKTLTILLIAVASVSLIVGGIGIMNVMLVSVTERTREIGVRVAVGATEGAIQLQFLGESILLSLVGGAAGVLFGLVGSYLVGQTLHWPMEMSLQAVVVAAVFSITVGVFFGYYPARKASRLNPIEALRYE